MSKSIGMTKGQVLYVCPNCKGINYYKKPFYTLNFKNDSLTFEGNGISKAEWEEKRTMRYYCCRCNCLMMIVVQDNDFHRIVFDQEGHSEYFKC